MSIVKRLYPLLITSLFSASLAAHHSPNVHFDRADVVEIRGVLTEVRWHNPHVVLKVMTRDANGDEIEWHVEETNTNVQLRRGVVRQDYEIGAEIRIAGFRGLRNRTAIFATNTLLADGRELIGVTSSGPRWSDDHVMTVGDYQAAQLNQTESREDGIFRVWSVAAALLRPGSSRANSPLWRETYPLTEQARRTLASWDESAQNPYLDCQNGMPAIMDTPAPMEFVRDGQDIILRLEEQDVVRRITMGSAAPEDSPSSAFGVSTGSWEGDTLVVHTKDIDWPWFDQSGVPQSDALTLVERFSVSEDGEELIYSVEATDPAVFTEPVVLEKRWASIPGEEVKPYECTYTREDL